MTQEATSKKTHTRYTALDYVWNNHREAVEDELKNMLDIDIIDFSLPVVFANRTTAAKTVLRNMTTGERETVYAEVQKYKTKGLPQDQQRQ